MQPASFLDKTEKLFENFDLSRASGGKKVAGRKTSGENAIRCRALKGRKMRV
jgi:hypothetical protein